MTNSIVRNTDEKYMIKTQYDYSKWLSRFQTILTKTERYASSNKNKTKIIRYYSSLINELKNYYNNNNTCLIIANDNNIQPFRVELYY